MATTQLSRKAAQPISPSNLAATGYERQESYPRSIRWLLAALPRWFLPELARLPIASRARLRLRAAVRVRLQPRTLRGPLAGRSRAYATGGQFRAPRRPPLRIQGGYRRLRPGLHRLLADR